MSKRSKRMLSLLLGAGLVLSTPAALAWSWNHRPDRRTVNSTDSNGPIPAREAPPIRFNSLSRQPPLPCTRVTGENAPDPGASDR
jgi:hypothetical protein